MSEKLESTYKSVGALYEDIKSREGEYALATLTDKNLVTVTPMDIKENIKITEAIVFEILEDNSLRRLNLEDQRKAVVKKLAKYIEPERLLMEILIGYTPEQMIELHERVIEKKGKVTSESGCYSLKIGGKRGTPFEVYLGGEVY